VKPDLGAAIFKIKNFSIQARLAQSTTGRNRSADFQSADARNIVKTIFANRIRRKP